MSNLKKRGVSALIWDFSGKISNQIVSVLVTVVLARILEPADFGLVAICLVFIGIAQVFTDVGLGSALIQRKVVTQSHYSSVFYFNIFVALIFTVGTFFAAGWLSSFYGNPALNPLLQVSSILFLLNAFSSVQQTRLRKFLKYSIIAKIEISASILSGIVGICLAFYGAGVWSLMAQILTQRICSNLFLWFSSGWKPSLSFSLTSLTDLWGYGFRMFLSGLIESIFTRLDYLIIGKLYAADILGFFDRAKNLNNLVVKYTSESLMSVLFPVFSEIQNDTQRLQVIVLKAVVVLSGGLFILIGGLYLTAQDLIVFLYSDKWLPSGKYIELLLLSACGYPLSALFCNILAARGKSKKLLKLQIVKKSFATLNFINIMVFGLESFLYGLVIVMLFSLSLNIYYSAKEIDMKSIDFAKPVLTQMLISIFSVWVTLNLVVYVQLSPFLNFIYKGVVFTLLYIVANALFKTQGYVQLNNFLMSKKI